MSHLTYFRLAALSSVLLAAVPLHAQDSPDTVASLPGIEIVTSVNRAEAYIGDLITYKVTVRYDSTIEMEPSPIGANLGGFDVKDYQSDITTKLPDGRLQTENVFVLSTFTTGQYVIPPLPIVFTLPGDQRKILLSETVPINVKSLLENAGDSVDIRPAKPQYEFVRDYTPYYIWGGSALAALLLAFLIWWQWFRKRKGLSEVIDLRPAWEIAFEKLALLKQDELPQRGEFKEYYTQLTEISREFLGRMYAINVLDMTTEEFMERMAEISMPDDFGDRTIVFLRHADLVKFAKFVPENGRTVTDYEFVHELIEKVRVDYLRKEAERMEALRQTKTSSFVPNREPSEPHSDQTAQQPGSRR